jgi:hypothetical protein
MRLRFAGVCRNCSTSVAAGEWAYYDRLARKVECLSCFEPAAATDAPNIDSGVAGASARREHERRVARREQRVRQAHPMIGGFLLALTDDPQSTRAWASGAVGEERLGQRLDGLVERGARVLHDRRIPGSHANIDHIVISEAGVYVIDAKRYKGQRPRLRVEGGLFRPRVEKLLVGSRDRTSLVDGVTGQVARVRDALTGTSATGAIPVRGVLCFVEADWPRLGGDFAIAGVDVVWPNKVIERVAAAPPVTGAHRVAEVYQVLGTVFRPA